MLKHNRFYVESDHHMVLRELLRDPTIAQARVHEDTTADVDEHGFVTSNKAEEMAENLHILREPDEDSDDDVLLMTTPSRKQQSKYFHQQKQAQSLQNPSLLDSCSPLPARGGVWSSRPGTRWRPASVRSARACTSPCGRDR